MNYFNCRLLACKGFMWLFDSFAARSLLQVDPHFQVLLSKFTGLSSRKINVQQFIRSSKTNMINKHQ
uniref:Uncharacterized protein n=1 Tax=Arundo donax TaxID=35708 RepID=A0A0A9FI66_ARUDO